MNRSIRTKLICIFLAFGITPMLILGAIAFVASNSTKDTLLHKMETIAAEIADKIDRNLFERYGDVQAFCLNRAILERESWYKPGADENVIVEVMNGYVDTYDIYYLTILVDLEGKVIAVNSKDQDGQPIDSAFIYDTDFSDREWFLQCKAGNFTTEMPFTAPENKQSTGTFIEDVHLDAEVQKIYGPGDSGLTLGFSAPARDEGGNVVGFWSNRTRFALVEDFFPSTYQTLAGELPGMELTLLDSTGTVIVDYDPMENKGTPDAVAHDFDEVLFKFNLVDKGVEVAKLAVAGESGAILSYHARKQIESAAGYVHLRGALGYPGMNWSVLARVHKDELLAGVNSQRFQIVAVIVVVAVLVGFLGWFVGTKAARPLRQTAAILEDIATGEGDLTKRLEVRSQDEIGQIAKWFNVFQDRLVEIIREIANNAEKLDSASRDLGSVASQLQAGVGLMCGKLEAAAAGTESSTRNVQSIAAGIEQSSSNANTVASATEQVSSNLNTVSAAVEEMSATMQGIAQTVENTTSAVNSVSAAIEELSASLGEVSGSTERASTTAQQAVDVAGRTSVAINKLGNSAQSIGKVVDIIQGIAAQTNLLALNATIEAASAGDAGKGFAVVANEVKELARQTSSATEEIRSQVEGMQADTQGSVTAIEEIVQIIGDLNDTFSTIASAVEEQNATVNEVARNVGSVARSAGEMSQNVKDSAAGALEVSRNVQEATRGASDISRSIGELAAGANEIASSAGSATRDMSEVLEGISEANRAALESKDGTDIVNTSAQSLADLSTKLKQVVDQFRF